MRTPIAHENNIFASGVNFHLPTEAQQEYAAKSGNKTRGSVKTKKPNELGLYDMSGTAGVKVPGSGSAKCQKPEKTSVEHDTDFAQIASCGIMSTPALVVDDKVVSYELVLNRDDVKKILQKIR